MESSRRLLFIPISELHKISEVNDPLDLFIKQFYKSNVTFYTLYSISGLQAAFTNLLLSQIQGVGIDF